MLKKLLQKNSSGGLLLAAVFIILLAIAAVLSFFLLDQRVFNYLSENQLNWHRNNWVIAFTYLGKVWMLIFLPLVWFIITGRQRTVQMIYVALILVFIIVQTLKYGVRRTRPYEIIRASQNGQQEDHIYSSLSFPSADTACAFAAATVIVTFCTWPYAILVLLVSSAIGFLRVTEMAHYPSDVLAGAAFGILSGRLGIIIRQKWSLLDASWHNYNRKLAVVIVILLPIAFWKSEGWEQFLIFLPTTIFLAIMLFLIARVNKQTGIS